MSLLNKTQSWRKVILPCLIIISVFGLFCSTAVLFPQVRKIIIQLTEQYLIHRKISFYDDWMNTLLSWAKGCIAILFTFNFFMLTSFGKALFSDILNEIKQCTHKIDFKSFKKPFITIFVVYLLGIISIIRADYSYIDDVDRALRGYHGWNGWSRHLADILSTFIHADTNLSDISPLAQLIAVLIMAVSSVLLIHILSGKFSFGTLIAVIPLGLSPYFLENLSYKFDAPYMAISVISCIVPFIFRNCKKAFIFTSIISLLIMCISYQASSGIYILITIMLFFIDWNNKNKTIKELLTFVGTAAVCFCVSLIIFRLVFMVSGTTGHGVSTSILPINHFFTGILENLKNYILVINSDFGIVWKIGIVLISVFFVIINGKKSQRRGFSRFFMPVLVLCVSFVFSYGAYIILETPLFFPRAFIGFGAFLAIISISLALYGNKTSLFFIFALNWCFFVFSFSYGNALSDQKRYNNFRVESLLRDLNRLFPDRLSSDPEIKFENNIGYGPYTQSIARHYPVIKKLVSLNRHYYIFKYMTGYFNFPAGNGWDDKLPDLPVVLDSYYHIIKSDGKHIIIIFRN